MNKNAELRIYDYSNFPLLVHLAVFSYCGKQVCRGSVS